MFQTTRLTPQPTLGQSGLEQFNEGGGRNWQYAPSTGCKNQPCLQQGRIDQRQRNHVTWWNGCLARPAKLKADAAVDASEGLHHFYRIGDEARIKIKRGLGQHLLNQAAARQSRVGECQRIRQAIAQAQIAAAG